MKEFKYNPNLKYAYRTSSEIVEKIVFGVKNFPQQSLVIWDVPYEEENIIISNVETKLSKEEFLSIKWNQSIKDSEDFCVCFADSDNKSGNLASQSYLNSVCQIWYMPEEKRIESSN